jgi:hypothetical protein
VKDRYQQDKTEESMIWAVREDLGAILGGVGKDIHDGGVVMGTVADGIADLFKPEHYQRGVPKTGLRPPFDPLGRYATDRE